MSEITVIVPVYKVEPYINICVDSILNQTFSDFDLVLVDDGSPDMCGKICDDYSSKDNRIVVIHQQNKGLSAARNIGVDWSIQNSNSKWITFIDSDDWVEYDYLKELYYAVTDSKQSVSVCSLVEESVYHTPNLPCVGQKYKVVDPEDLWCFNRANSVVACGKMFRKDMLTSIRFPVGKIHEDEHTTYKLLFQCKKISYINKPLYHYYKNPCSITKENWTPKKFSAIEAQKNQIDYFSKKGLKNAEKSTYESLLNLARTYVDLCKKTKKYSFYLFPLLFCLKQYGYLYHRKIHADISENEWFYAKAFPLFIKIRSVIKKLKKV